VKEIAYMGDASVYLVQLESGKQLRATMPNVGRETASLLAREDAVWVSWHPTGPLVLVD
jgi:putrescine transport system ATP-binding protein